METITAHHASGDKIGRICFVAAPGLSHSVHIWIKTQLDILSDPLQKCLTRLQYVRYVSMSVCQYVKNGGLEYS